MKSIGLTILFIFIIGGVSKAQNCDCTIYPFKPDPPCYEKCTAKILANAVEEELELIVGLDKHLAGKIVEFDGRRNADSLEPYRHLFDKKEFETLDKKLRSLNKLQIEYFQKPEPARANIRRELRKLLGKPAIMMMPEARNALDASVRFQHKGLTAPQQPVVKNAGISHTYLYPTHRQYFRE